MLACGGNTKEQGGSTPSNAGAPGAGSSAGASNVPVGSGGSGGGLVLDLDAGLPAFGGSDTGGGAAIIQTLPDGFHATDIGGYLLGAPLAAAGASGAGSGGAGSGAAGSANGNCGNVLLGVGRDFRGATEMGGNPDFESRTFRGTDVTPKLVAAELGPDQKPVYASSCEASNVGPAAVCPFGAQTTTQANFDQWYRDTPGVNQAFVVSLYLAPQPGGLFTFQSLHYFPLDGAGYGLSGRADDRLMHNFGFTTEIHTQFAYNGGETFEFQGDDDVWVYINGTLTVDLGGVHPRTPGRVSLDDSAAVLGIEKGKVYGLDLFHAERHTDKSTFRIDTNLSFVNCGTVEPIPK